MEEQISKLKIKRIVELLIMQPSVSDMKGYAKSAIRDVFLQSPTSSIYKLYWESYMKQISSELGEDNTLTAWQELIHEEFIIEDEYAYMWRRTFGPVNSPPPLKSHTLTEWADGIDTKDKEYRYNDESVIPFIYNMDDNQTYLGKPKGTHNTIFGEFPEVFANLKYGMSSLHNGRLWLNDKLISFWRYPQSVDEFKKIILSIAKEGVHIDSSWKIDIPLIPEMPDNLDTTDILDYQAKSGLLPVDDYDTRILMNPLGYLNSGTIEESTDNHKYEYGCLMLQSQFPVWEDFVDSLIDKEDLYQPDSDEFGMEYEPHITVLYGFHDDTDLEKVKQLTSKAVNSVMYNISTISHFESTEYDVVKLDIKSVQLQILNKIMRDNFNYTSDYPEYHPHMTIAYVKKGLGKTYNRKLKQIVQLSSNKFVYSFPDERKEYFNI